MFAALLLEMTNVLNIFGQLFALETFNKIRLTMKSKWNATVGKRKECT